jgi:hypothetical protein
MCSSITQEERERERERERKREREMNKTARATKMSIKHQNEKAGAYLECRNLTYP